MACTLVVFDNNSHGEGRAALVSAFLARVRLVDEVSYLVAVDDVLGFLEASARPVPAGRVVFNPAPVGCVGDIFEGFVKAHHVGCSLLSVLGASYLVAFYCTTVSVVFAYVGVTVACCYLSLRCISLTISVTMSASMPETVPPAVFRVMVMVVRSVNAWRSVFHASAPVLSVIVVWCVRETKSVVDVPVISSLPCASVWWMSTVGVSATKRSSNRPVSWLSQS